MNKKISVVAPLFNESLVVEQFVQEVSQVLSGLHDNFEIILVDDGSNDGTKEKLRDLSINNSHIIPIFFSRNFGQHPAILAGLTKASGETIVVMDADLQDDPAAIPLLFAEMGKGFDVVFVNRMNRKPSRFYIIGQKFFYGFLSRISNLQFNPNFGNFSMISRRVLDSYLSLNGSIGFYPAAIKWLGFPSSTVDYQVRMRPPESNSKYTFTSRVRLALQVIISHSERPLRLIVLVGAFFAITGIILALIVFWAYFNGKLTQPGWPSLFVATVLFSGFQFLSLGSLGLYIAEINKVTKNRPLYVVEKEIAK